MPATTASLSDAEKGLGPGPSQYAFDLHRPDILSRLYIEREWAPDDDVHDSETFRINLAHLQRMRLRDLQASLIKEVFGLYSPGWTPGTNSGTRHGRDNLREYVQALQDYEYMHKFAGTATDPFFLTGENLVERNIFAEVRKGNEPAGVQRRLKLFEGRRPQEKPVLFPRDKHASISKQRRVVVSVASGLWLLAPMWIMVLYQNAWSGLVTGTVFVLAFGLCAALYLSEEKDVVAATAAYAAVLVVFVSINTGSESPLQVV